jgi:hypothetical protein
MSLIAVAVNANSDLAEFSRQLKLLFCQGLTDLMT